MFTLYAEQPQALQVALLWSLSSSWPAFLNSLDFSLHILLYSYSWSTDQLIDELIDWLIDWLIDQLIDWLIVWPPWRCWYRRCTSCSRWAGPQTPAWNRVVAGWWTSLQSGLRRYRSWLFLWYMCVVNLNTFILKRGLMFGCDDIGSSSCFRYKL